MYQLLRTLLPAFVFSTVTANAQAGPAHLGKATHHPMQYYISLPANWSANTRWPVVVVLEAAEKEFRINAERFANARGKMPFIIVAPVITTNGQHGYRDSTVYPYPRTVWDTIDKVTTCTFDMEGLKYVISDLVSNYSATDKIFITGFEAGTHLLWAMVFEHPELLYAAAPVAGNYRSRCIQEQAVSNDSSRIQLPVKNFTGSLDKDFGVNGTYYYQYNDAKTLALAHGYKNISETVIQGKGHEPLPQEVLEYFNTVWLTIKN